MCTFFFALCIFLKHISFWIKWSTHQTVVWFMWRLWFCIPGSHIGLMSCVGVSLGTWAVLYVISDAGCGICSLLPAHPISKQCWPCQPRKWMLANQMRLSRHPGLQIHTWPHAIASPSFVLFFLLIDMKSTTQGITLRQQGFHEVNKRRTFLQDNSWIKKRPEEEK